MKCRNGVWLPWSFASGPGWLEPVGDGKTPAGTRKGELTGARAALGKFSFDLISTGMSPDGVLCYNSGGARSGLNGTKGVKQLYFVSLQSWEDSAGPSPVPSPTVSEQIYIRKDGLLDLCSLTALLPWALQPKWTQSQGHQQLGFWNMLTFNGQQIPTDPQTKVCLEEVVGEGLSGENW